MDARLEDLKQWLSATLPQDEFSVTTASADASFRRYFRVSLADKTWVAMDAPPDKEDCTPFVDVAGRLLKAGVNAPSIEAHDERQGFMLLTDLGDRQYLRHLDAESVERLYGDALAALLSMQACADIEGLPPYDYTLLMREMGLFEEWYLGTHLKVDLSEADVACLHEAFELLAQSALQQPQVFVHRDYHSRNLMLVDEHNPGIIDFQDAVYGPVTYDLVSLLKDCYIAWPREQVEDWALGYYQLALQSGVLTEADQEARFLRWFDLMGVQRHLKATGIFARLYHRDGKDGYLKDIPRTLAYIEEVAGRYQELAGLAELLARHAHGR